MEIYIWILDRKLLLKLISFLCKIQLLSLGYFWYFYTLIPWYFETLILLILLILLLLLIMKMRQQTSNCAAPVTSSSALILTGLVRNSTISWLVLYSSVICHLANEIKTLSDFHCGRFSGLLQNVRRAWDVIHFLISMTNSFQTLQIFELCFSSVFFQSLPLINSQSLKDA